MDDRASDSARSAGYAGSVPGRVRYASGRVDLFYCHLLWLIVLGVTTLYWLGVYTDWLQTVIGLLGLGGIFAWIAFLSKIISDARKTQLQQAFDKFLSHKWMGLVLVVLTVFMAFIAGNFGCLIADSGRDSLGHHLEIRQPGNTQPCRSRSLQPSLVQPFLLYTGLRGRTYEIDIKGLPLRVQRVHPLSRIRLRVPGDFFRGCVLLIRPGQRLSSYSSEPDAEHELMVRIDDSEPQSMSFRGHSIWIGSDKTLAIPAHLRQNWHIEVGADTNTNTSTLLRWLQPDVFKTIPVLKAGQEVEIAVIAKGAEEPFVRLPPATIQPCDGQENFPTIFDIEMN
ncbi:hypothetical protein ACFL6U_15720 [Planctomycetota bacterium]